MTSTSENFDWGADDSIAVRSQPAIAVYANKFGHVVIRQEREWDQEDDTFVYVSRENVLAVVHAILVNGGYEDAHLYEQRGMGCYDIDWPEGPLSPREVAMVNTRPDINWQAALEDFKEVKPEAEPERVSVKERRARVAESLKADPERSNRSIAADCGVSDKTVAAVRAEIGAEAQNNSAENAREDAEFRSQEALQLIAAA